MSGDLAAAVADLATQVGVMVKVDELRRAGDKADLERLAEAQKEARAERAEVRTAVAALDRRLDAQAADLAAVKADLAAVKAELAAVKAELAGWPRAAAVSDVADEVSERLARRDAEAATRRPWGQIVSGLLAALATALSAYAASRAPPAAGGIQAPTATIGAPGAP